jgi:4-hydroxymandelate oxidase
MLRGVGTRAMATTVLGTPVSMPILVPPMGFHGLCHVEAEEATARATAAEGTIFCASTVANRSLETIAQASSGPKWFQLYVYRDKEITRSLVERAVAAGYQALCLTVDTPLAGQRERDRRNQLRMPAHLELGNFPAAHTAMHHTGGGTGSSLAAYIAAQWDAGLTWDDVDWLRSISPLPVVIKGVLAPADAKLSVEHGAAAVIVSNHGGRQLDAAVAGLRVLPAIVAQKGAMAVMLDGGIRRGTDVLKALALGADFVWVGRPFNYAAAIAGEEGVRHAVRILGGEVQRDMALLGVNSLAELGPERVVRLGR